jgi:hypothetical protein
MAQTDNTDRRVLTKELIEKWLQNEEEEFAIEAFRKKHNIEAESDNFYKVIGRKVEGGELFRLKRGWYRKIKQLPPIKWWDGDRVEPLALTWPYGMEISPDGDVITESEFGFENKVEVYPGDSIMIAGNSNWGKTSFARNLMVNNLDLFPGTLLMVNEYKPQRFRAEMERYKWVSIWDGDRPRFETLAVTDNHIDYIRRDWLNIIDWLHIKGEFWTIADLIEQMQMKVGNGLLVILTQKTGEKDRGVGGDWGVFFPAVYMTISPPGKLELVKVKSSPSGVSNPQGKLYAFDIIERGSQFRNIREVINCPSCKGRRVIYGDKCKKCEGKGYKEIE